MWNDQLRAELSQALISRANRDSQIDSLLYAWGDYCGVDSWYIWNQLGCQSIFGAIMRQTIQTVETTSDAKANRPRELYSENVYRQVDLLRRTMPDKTRAVLDLRYWKGKTDKQIKRKLKTTSRGLNLLVMDLRDIVYNGVDSIQIMR